MAAADTLFDDGTPARMAPARGAGHVAPVLPLLPMLQPVDEPRLEQRPHRFLAVNELDGPDYDDAIDCADAAAGERDASLYGTTENVRVGWTKDAAA